MSSIFFQLGTHSHNRALPSGGFKSGKGIGIYSNPVGITTGNIRPLTNKDPTNNTPQKFGLPRPIKHYRNGIISKNNTTNTSSTRQVQSYTGNAHMVSRLMDYPGGASFTTNTNTTSIQSECATCPGVGVVSTYQPSADLTDNPSPQTQTPTFCCNEEYKSRKRVIPTSTNLKKKYYTTTYAYLYNRCNTFEQRQFNYLTSGNVDSEPGGPNATENTYRANCNPNFVVMESTDIDKLSNQGKCAPVMYKPNNYTFSKQGAVSSSNHILQKTVNTIKTAANHKVVTYI